MEESVDTGESPGIASIHLSEEPGTSAQTAELHPATGSGTVAEKICNIARPYTCCRVMTTFVTISDCNIPKFIIKVTSLSCYIIYFTNSTPQTSN